MSTHELQNEARNEQKTPGQTHQHVMIITRTTAAEKLPKAKENRNPHYFKAMFQARK